MPVREVGATVDFSGGQADAMIEQASQPFLTVRSFEPYPDVGQPVRVLFSLAGIEDDLTGADSVRVAGRADKMEPAGAVRRLEIKIGSVTDNRMLDKLAAWLAG